MPLGEIREVQVQFETEIIGIRMIVTNAQTYHTVLGNNWLKKARAGINFETQRMTFWNHGRKFSIPLDIRRGVTPRLTQLPEDDESDEEKLTPGEAHLQVAQQAMVVVSEEYRQLNKEERNALIEYNMKMTKCPFCQKQIYCAEMMCSCSSTQRISYLRTLESYLPKTKPKVPKQLRRRTMPAMSSGPYNGWNPHPFENNTGRVYDIFWDNWKYVGKKRFWGNRWIYEQGCYWDEIPPQDLWEVWNSAVSLDEPLNIEYQDTWQEQADIERINEQPEEEEQVVPDDWEDDLYVTQQERELSGLFDEDEDTSGLVLEEESDTESEDEIIDLVEIHHYDRQEETNKMRHWFWRDLWEKMPVDNTYQQWRTEVDEHTETTGILQQGARRPRDLVQKVVANVFQVEEQEEQVKVKKLQPDAIIPRRATTGAAGYDLYAAHDSKLEGKSMAMIGTGVAIAIPPGQHGQIRSRSGLFKNAGLTAFPGTIDQDYRGEIIVMMINNRLGAFEVYKGDRIVQIIIIKNETTSWKEVAELDGTKRGARGFGSTGQANIIIE